MSWARGDIGQCILRPGDWILALSWRHPLKTIGKIWRRWRDRMPRVHEIVIVEHVASGPCPKCSTRLKLKGFDRMAFDSCGFRKLVGGEAKEVEKRRTRKQEQA